MADFIGSVQMKAGECHTADDAVQLNSAIAAFQSKSADQMAKLEEMEHVAASLYGTCE